VFAGFWRFNPGEPAAGLRENRPYIGAGYMEEILAGGKIFSGVLECKIFRVVVYFGKETEEDDRV